MADTTGNNQGKTLFGISKTTIQGALTSAIGILTALLTYQVPSALSTPHVTHVWLWLNVGVNVALLILKPIVAALQGDAPNP